jgi:hypothetical protein
LIAIVVFILLRRRANETLVKPQTISDVLYDEVTPLAQGPGQNNNEPEGYAAFGPIGHLSDMFVPGASNPLYSWYQPDASKESCMSQLQDAEAGSFIVRDFAPTPGWHMIHVRVYQDVLSEKIRMTQEGHYQLVGEAINPRGRMPSFGALPELVKHYASPQQQEFPVCLTVSNPIYDNSNLANRAGQKGQLPELDESRPNLPLRSAERSAAQAFADQAGDEIYTNNSDAKQLSRPLRGDIQLDDSSI